MLVFEQRGDSNLVFKAWVRVWSGPPYLECDWHQNADIKVDGWREFVVVWSESSNTQDAHKAHALGP